MSNLKLTGFIIFGLALSMGIILWSMHETTWATTLFVLAGLQAIITALNWNKERRRGFHKHPKRT